MSLRTTITMALIIMGISLSGCYTTQVRHLAADVALLKIGQSTQEDTLIYLGEPDEQVDVGNGVVKWLYRDTDVSLIEKTPLVGKHIGSPEHHNVVVTFTDGVVSNTTYTASDEDDLDWADDYSWQKKAN